MPILNAECTWDEVQGVDGYNVYLKGGNLNNHSLSFDGIDDYVRTIQYPFSTNEFTLMAWVNPESGQTDSRGTVIAQSGSTYLQLDNNRVVQVGYYNVSGNFQGYFSSTSSIPNGEWTHIAVTLSSDGTINIYINGQLDGTFSTSNNGIQVNPSTNLEMGAEYGADGSNQNRHYKGLADEFQLWNIPLTQSQIEENRDKILNGDETGLVGYWNCEDRASQLTDLTSNNNHGTINGVIYSEDTALFKGDTFIKQNTSLIPTPEFTIEDLPNGDHEAYCTAVEEGMESEPSNIEAFSVQPEPTVYIDLPADSGTTPNGDDYTAQSFIGNGGDIVKVGFYTEGGGSGSVRERKVLICTETNGIPDLNNIVGESAVVDVTSLVQEWSYLDVNPIPIQDGVKYYFLVQEVSGNDRVGLSSQFTSTGEGRTFRNKNYSAGSWVDRADPMSIYIETV